MKEWVLTRAQQFTEKHSGVAAYFGYLVNKLPHVDIVNEEHLTSARNWLRAGGSLLLYAGPHRSYLDLSLAAQQVVIPFLEPLTVGVFLSDKFTGNVITDESMGIASAAIADYAKLVGFTLLPVVQEKYINEANKAPAEALNNASNHRAKEILDKPGGVVIMVPEGHREREKDGLLRAYKGPGILVGRSKLAAALPIVFWGVENILPSHSNNLRDLNLTARVKATVGQMITYGKALEYTKILSWKDKSWGRFTVADYFMLHLRKYGIPPKKNGVDPLGVYTDENIIQVAKL